MLGEIDRNKTKPRKMELYLAKPDRTIIGKISHRFNVVLTTRLNEVNELNFNIPYHVTINHRNVRHPQVDMMRDRYKIKAKIGDVTEWFVISNPVDNSEAEGDYKSIQAYSLGFELRDRVIRELDITTDDATEDGEIVANARDMLIRVLSGTNWNVGYIDSDFELAKRTFSVSETTVLDMIFEIAQTFNAIITWNTEQKQINLFAPDRIGQNKGFKIKYGKYLEELVNSHEVDDYCTRFKPYGRDNLTIQRVNPTGMHYIEDYSYFMYPFERDKDRNVIRSSHYMSDELCHHILDYQEKIENFSGLFKEYISELEKEESNWSNEYAVLVDLENELAILNDQLNVAYAKNAPYDDIKYPYDHILDEINQKESEIRDQEALLETIEHFIDDIHNDIEDLKEFLDPMTVFSDETMSELVDSYIVEKTWIDENYFDDEELYADAIKRFSEHKEPPQNIEMSIINFLEVVESQHDWDKINLGDVITIEYNKFNIYVQAKITEIEYDYEEGLINLVISNVEKLNKKSDLLDELYRRAVNTSITLDMNKFKWDGYEHDNSEIKQVLDNFWDWVHNEIEMSVNNTVLLNRQGITVYDDEDPCRFVRITNGVIGITNDCGNTYRHAITSKGIIGEHIMGRIITGQNVVIGDPDGILEILGNKGVVSNRDGEEVMRFGLIETDPEDCFGIHLENDVNQVIMSDCVGFRINKWENGNWVKKFHADDTGRLIVEDILAKRIEVRDSNEMLIIDTDENYFNIGRFETIISDGKLNELEKHQLSKELRRIKKEKIELIGAYSGTGDPIGGHAGRFNLIDREDEIGVEQIRGFVEDYYQHYVTLLNYLEPLIADKTTNIEIDRNEFETHFENYFDSALRLINEINNILERSSLQLGRNYNGVVIDSFSGVVVTRGDDRVRTVLNATEGIYIEKLPSGEKTFYVDTDGNINIRNSGGEFTFDKDGLAIVAGDNNFTINKNDGLNFIIYFSGTNNIRSQFTMDNSGNFILSTRTENTSDGGDTFKLTNTDGLEMKVGSLPNEQLEMGVTFSDGFYLRTFKNDGFSESLLTQDGLELKSNMVDGYDGVVEAGLTLNKGLYMSHRNNSDTSGMVLGIQEGVYLYSNEVYDDGSMLQTGFSLDEGFFIKKNGDPVFWVGNDGELKAKQITIVPDDGTPPMEDIDGSYISDLMVNSLKSLSLQNPVDHVHIQDNYLKLKTRSGNTEIEKFALTFEGTGYDSYPIMIFGSGDSTGDQIGYIIKDSNGFTFDYTNYAGNMRRIDLRDSQSEGIIIEADGGEVRLRSTENIISMNNSRILLDAGQAQIELSRSTGRVTIQGSRIDFVQS